MRGRTLAELGLAVAPRAEPLTYPGAWPTESGLLSGDRLLPLPPGRRTYEDRVPVLAVGSNACPGQLRDKLDEFGIRSPVPMVAARVTGVDTGVSAHVSLMGYVSAAPFASPGTVRELFVIWLDAGQLAVVDASEGVTRSSGAYDRAWLPGGAVRIETAAGPPLPGVHAYVNRHGVLHDGTRTPRRHPGERRLLTELLAASPRLREMFGETPEEFSARARFDRGLCDKGTRVLAEEDLVVASGLERYVPPSGARWYGDAGGAVGDVRARRGGGV
ncbi:hypothetical protein GCM10010145_18040 [Streptomyces ruber]|uniref:Uncharacterized protein n=2 Tax=Streptomyces TaxID=1883 RepID=A0A918EPL0_9ACTN|nr:hypothetical protein [Streptomyces ruber]GGQ49549.1 hypothetical protein GCM10010145_18040 [Streptomyces ruber]